MRHVAMPLSSSIEPRGWSRIDAARCTTVSTPRSALRKEGGSARSPSAICTRTRWVAQPPRVANEAAHVGSFGHQAAKQRGADEAGRAGKEQHRSYNMPLPEPARAGSPVETRKPTERSRWPT